MKGKGKEDVSTHMSNITPTPTSRPKQGLQYNIMNSVVANLYMTIPDMLHVSDGFLTQSP